MNTTSGDLQQLWNQLVGLATAQGDLRAEQRNLRGRVTRVEQWQQWMLANWPRTPVDAGEEEPEAQENLLQKIFRLRELAEAVVMLMKIARHLPWGTLVLVAVSLYKWAVPIARDTGLAFLRWLGL